MQRRANDTIAAILEGAAHILERAGFEGYTTNAIAERAGVSIGSLYQYFPGKDAVTIALIERELAILVDDIRAAFKSGHPAHPEEARAGLRGLIAAAVRHQRRRPALARWLDVEEARLAAVMPASGAVDIARAEIVAFVVRARGIEPAAAPAVAVDIIGITRALTDASAHRDDVDEAALAAAIEGAIVGYLDAVTRRSPLRA